MPPDVSGTGICTELRRKAGAQDLPIIVLRARTRVADRISGGTAGADQYFTKPFDVDEVIACVGKLLEGQAGLLCNETPLEAPTRGRIVGVYGAKGGVGQTVVAANLAIAIGETTKQRVVLVDANMPSGDVAVLLETHPRYGMLDLMSRADDVDQELINAALTPHSSGIEVLTAHDGPDVNGTADATALRKVLTALRDGFDYVVVDSPPYPGRGAPAGLEVADRVLLVTTAEVTSIRRARLFLDRVRFPEHVPATVHVILNRFDYEKETTLRDLENALGGKLCGTIPDEPALVARSVNEGVPFVISHRRSNVSKRLFKLATTITVETTQAVAVT